VKVNEPELPLLAPAETLKVLLPLFAGAPGHALDVHDVTVCAAPLVFVQVTADATEAPAASGL